MFNIKSKVRRETHQALRKLSQENYRSLSDEIAYRLDQAIRYKTHLSDDDISLFKLISELSEEEEPKDNVHFLNSEHKTIQ